MGGAQQQRQAGDRDVGGGEAETFVPVGRPPARRLQDEEPLTGSSRTSSSSTLSKPRFFEKKSTRS